MSNIAQQMLDKKRLLSPFVQLKDDKEEIEGLIIDLKQVTKQGFGGEEIEVLRMILQCDIPEVGIIKKNFDNGSMRWLDEVTKKNLEKGDTIKIVRHGEYKSNKTYYEATVLLKQGQKIEEETETPAPADEPPLPDQE